MSIRVYIDMPNIIGDNIAKLYAVVETKDGRRLVSEGDITVWAKEITDEGPKVNQKVKVTDNNGNVTYGTITKIFPPCERHSGRFVVEMHSKGRDHCEEFWYSDFGKSVEVCK